MTSDLVPETMTAAVIERFGGPDELQLRSRPTPPVGPHDVLLRVEVAGLGSWDAEERRGEYAEYLGPAEFPYVLGWEGAGSVAAIGPEVDGLRVGDRVYGTTVPSGGGGGGYAEYMTLAAEHVAPIPDGLTVEQAAVVGWDALTAISGLEEALSLRPGETLMVFGASGGVGHLAVQLAERSGVRVLAVASGADGVALVGRLGATVAVDGRGGDILAAARHLAPQGLDAALLLAGGPVAEQALAAVRAGGRVAHPNGLVPAPTPRNGVSLTAYDATRGSDASDRLAERLGDGSVQVHVGEVFPLERVADAHRALEQHYVGKLALRMQKAPATTATAGK